MKGRCPPSFAASSAYRRAAMEHLAFGVSSTPRAAQVPTPIVAERAEGAHIVDADGNRYIDYALGYGPLILGHTPEPVVEAVQAEMARGLRVASVHRSEATLARLILECVPSAEVTALVSTGSEAVQLAIRIARAATGRNRIVRFRDNYHGWFDNVHVAGAHGDDGPATIGQDPGAAAAFVLLDWGDADALEEALTDDFAAVLLEPAAINAGCFAPPPGFLERVRTITRRRNVLLIFDEVITGFRLALGGAQALYRVAPDLSVFGKALGGGLPLAAVSGSREAMRPVSSGALLHRGTFNGNPLSVAAAIACVSYLQANSAAIYPRLTRFAEDLCRHITSEARRTDAPVTANQVGPAVQIFAGVRSLTQVRDLHRASKAQTLAFTGALLGEGIHTLPRGLMYISTAHSNTDIALTKQAISAAFASFMDGAK